MNKRISRLFWFFFVLIFAITTFMMPGFAVEKFDTQMVADAQFCNHLLNTQIASIKESNNLTNEERLEQMVTLLFHAKAYRISHPDEDEPDFSLFFSNGSRNECNLTYFLNCIYAKAKRIPTVKATILWCEPQLIFNDINISEHVATVKVQEFFQYQISFQNAEDPEPISIEKIPYEISFVQIEKQWFITDIIFYDDSTERLRNEEYTVSDYLEGLKYIAEEEEKDEAETTVEENNDGSKGVIYSFLSLSPSLVASYAQQYAVNYNTKFADYSQDCQNFASQCIWYGLGGADNSAAIEGIYLPMVPPGSRAWFARKTTYPLTPTTWVWTYCSYFGNYVLGGGSNVEGPTGTISSGISNASVGDIIQYKQTTYSDYDHAYVVTAVTGSYGSRTPSNITVCCHTTDRCNENLGSIYDNSLIYRTIHVTGGYYSY